MELGDGHEGTVTEEPLVFEKPRPLPWLLFIVVTLVLVTLSAYFGRLASAEAARADAAVEKIARGQATAQELSATVDSLQKRTQELGAEVKKLTAERDEQAQKLKGHDEKPVKGAGKEKAPAPVAKKGGPARKKKH